MQRSTSARMGKIKDVSMKYAQINFRIDRSVADRLAKVKKQKTMNIKAVCEKALIEELVLCEKEIRHKAKTDELKRQYRNTVMAMD